MTAAEVPALDLARPKVRRLLRSLCLAAGDLAALTLSVILAVAIWALAVRGQSLSLYGGLWPLGVLFPIAWAMMGLYPGFGIGAVETIRRLSLATGAVFGILATANFVLKVPHQYSRASFFLALILTLFLVPLTRFILLSVVRNRDWWSEPAVLIGDGELANMTISALDDARSLGYRVRWVMPTDRDVGRGDFVTLGSEADLDTLGAGGVRVALLATSGEQWRDWVEVLRPRFRRVIVVRASATLPLEGVAVRNLGGVLGIEFQNQLLRRRNRIVKRFLDLALSIAMLGITAPFILGAAVLVLIADGRPVFFSQTRVGLNQRRFKLWKLRTMRRDAEAVLERYLSENPTAKREWTSKFKLRYDPRILPVVGRLIRRFSIDELPQFLNILRGEMNLVGPRPLPDYHLEAHNGRFVGLRSSVRPGLTGLCQVVARRKNSLSEEEFYDSYYIRNWSVWMDLYILGRTIGTILTGHGE